MSNEIPQTNSKRSFLKLALLFLGGMVGALSSWGIVRFVFVGTKPKKNRELSRETFNTMKQGEPTFFPQAESWVIRGPELSSSFALDDRCSHLGCRYKWNQEKRLFECPCHGSEFDIDGNVKRAPASKPLVRLFLTEESDHLIRITDQPQGK